MIDYNWFDGTSNDRFRDALSIRQTVFIHEQNVAPELEVDGEDDSKSHVVGYLDRQPIATARIGFIDDNKTVKIQRVAVLSSHRGKNFGLGLLEEIEKEAQNMGAERLILSSQDHAIPFYEKLGYSVSNKEGYLDAGIPHHDMEKEI